MADPILTDIWRALVVMPGLSGLPEDVYVNSWAFRNDQVEPFAIPDITAAIARVLRAFYTAAAANAGVVAGSLSPELSRVANAAEIRIYDLGTPPPRVPHIQTMTLPAGGTSALPGEVAVVGSFVSERNLPRQRGRVYIGPLATTAMVQDATTKRAKVSGTFVDTLIDRFANVMNTTENVTWGVVSQRAAAFRPITGGWVDDEFDTQRRRGYDALLRKSYGSFTS